MGIFPHNHPDLDALTQRCPCLLIQARIELFPAGRMSPLRRQFLLPLPELGLDASALLMDRALALAQAIERAIPKRWGPEEPDPLEPALPDAKYPEGPSRVRLAQKRFPARAGSYTPAWGLEAHLALALREGEAPDEPVNDLRAALIAMGLHGLQGPFSDLHGPLLAPESHEQALSAFERAILAFGAPGAPAGHALAPSRL